MNLPDIQGTLDQQGFFFYTACDSAYFDQFGPALINSVLQNTPYGIHLHIYNPTDDQKNFCQRGRVSISYEIVRSSDFNIAAHKLLSDTSEPGQDRLRRTKNAMVKGQDINIEERMLKTYFACARFIRLSGLFTDVPCLAIDVDALVRGTPDHLEKNRDFYIYKIEGNKARYLAGGLWLWPTDATRQFLREYSNQLFDMISRDEIYWGMDQDLLDPIVPKYCHGRLPLDLIDWNMRPESKIWTAKGTRKNLEVFVNEQIRYRSL